MHRIIIDTDPGIGTKNADFDDGLAIFLALQSPLIKVMGITTVHGNVPVETGTKNTLRLLHLLSRKVKVARGASSPLFPDEKRKMNRPIEDIEGIPPFNLEMRNNLVSISAFNFIKEVVNRGEDKITLLCIGPLTNIALFLIQYPELKERIEQIVIMGGSAFYPGNVTPLAEFNLWMDPEAAHIVFTCGVPIVMVGLNVTHKVRFTEDAFSSLLGKKKEALGKLFYLSALSWLHYLEEKGIEGCFMHDAMVLAYLIDESILTTKDAYVDVETKGALSRGQTVVDMQGKLGRKPNTRVCMDVDREKFRSLILTFLENL